MNGIERSYYVLKGKENNVANYVAEMQHFFIIYTTFQKAYSMKAQIMEILIQNEEKHQYHQKMVSKLKKEPIS